MKIIDLKQNTKEWLEYRKSHFNASETPELFGVGFLGKSGPEKLAKIKYKDAVTYQNEAMKKGQEAEPEIRANACKITGADFKPAVGVWDKDERFSASFDGIDIEQNLILEIKFSKNEFEYVKQNGKPSEKYLLQVNHQLMVSGAEICYFFVKNNETAELTYCIVYPDLEIMQNIRDKWELFASKYGDGEFLIDENIDESIDEKWESDINELKKITEQIKKLDEKSKKIKAEIVADIKDRSGDKFNGFGVSISRVKSKTYDYKGFLKANNLTLTDDFCKSSESFRFTFLKEK